MVNNTVSAAICSIAYLVLHIHYSLYTLLTTKIHILLQQSCQVTGLALLTLYCKRTAIGVL